MSQSVKNSVYQVVCGIGVLSILFLCMNTSFADDVEVVVPKEILPLVDMDSSFSGKQSSLLDMEMGGVYKKDEVLIRFKESVSVDSIMGSYQVEALAKSVGHEVKEFIPEANIALVGTPEMNPKEAISSHAETIAAFSFDTESDTGESVSAMIELYKKDPRIEQVQPNYRYELQSIPNDPQFGYQWGLHNTAQSISGTIGIVDADIDYPEAMDLYSGSISSGVTVAVLDGGIDYDHPDMQGHLWDGSNCLSYTGGFLGGCKYGYDFYYGDKDPFNDYADGSHGTMVSSIIAAATNNGTGMDGIAPNAKIMAVRVCGSFGCYTSDIIKGIQFAQRNGAKVINASFGGARTMSGISNYDMVYHDALANFPGVFVTSAGNETEDNDAIYSFPAAFGQDITLSGEVIQSGVTIYSGNVTVPALSNIISVAATDQNDALAWFSNYGANSVDIAAPGTHILGATANTFLTATGYISSASGWVSDGQSPYFWHDAIDMSGQLIGTWGDYRYPYVTSANTTFTKSYYFTGTTTKSLKMYFWCDTPTATGYTDYLEISYSTGGIYAPLLKVDEDLLSWLGTEVAFGTHTGAYDWWPVSFTASGSAQLRFRWISDSITQLDQNNDPHYGCLIYNTIQEIARDRGITGTYKYNDGTSFSSPMVAGAAALALGQNSGLSVSEIKDSILRTGDDIVSLSGKTRTGKRLNVERMLTYINYLNNPLPTPSHSDAVYRDPFTYTLTGEGLFYSAQSTNRIHYDIYLSGALSETGEVDGSGFQRTFSGADIVVNYYGKNSSGTITTVKQSKFYYDAFAPILNEYIPNNLTQTGWSAQAVYTGASFSGNVYFITGSVVSGQIQAADTSMNFGNSGQTFMVNAISPVFSQFQGVSSVLSGNTGISSTLIGNFLPSIGRNDYSYALTDLVGNSATRTFSLYRLPNLSASRIYYTGGELRYEFLSDTGAMVEYQYSQSGVSYSGMILAHSGTNFFTLSGIILSGTVQSDIRLAAGLIDVILPESVRITTLQSVTFTFDDIPDLFILQRKLGVAPNTLVTFGPVVPVGFNIPVPISVTTGSLRVNGAYYGTGMATIYPGDNFSIEVTSFPEYNRVLSGVLSLGSQQIIYEVENALAPSLSIIGGGGGGGGGGGSNAIAGIIASQGTIQGSTSSVSLNIALILQQALQRNLGTDVLYEAAPQGPNISSIQQGFQVTHTNILGLLVDNSSLFSEGNVVSRVYAHIFTPIYEQIQTIESHNKKVYSYNSLIRQSWNQEKTVSENSVLTQLQALGKQLKEARTNLISSQ